MSKEKRTQIWARIFIALAIFLSVMHVATSIRVRNYRYRVAKEYGLSCKWYEEPVFYRHEEKWVWNDGTGDFIQAHNIFDSDPFCGFPREELEHGEIGEFNELKETQIGWTTAWLLYIIPFAVGIIVAKGRDKEDHEES